MSISALEGQIYLNLKIDNKDLPTSGNFLKEIQVIESVSNLIPTFMMSCNDDADVFINDITLSDGNLFDFTIGTTRDEVSEGENKNFSKKFRLFSYKGERFSTGYNYNISGIYDAPKFTMDVNSKLFKGTSYDVLQKIATDCKFDFNGDPTDDYQHWLNISDTYANFARKIGAHAYRKDGLPLLALMSDDSLYYKDAIEVLKTEPEFGFSSTLEQETDGFFPALEWQIYSNAGSMNSWINYGFNLFEPRLDGSVSEYNKISLSTDGAFVPVNADVSDSLTCARMDYAPIDCGNTHKRYWQAFHSNLRLAALFSQKIIVLTNSVTNFNLLDGVGLKINNQATNKPNAFSGRYLITAKKTIIRGTRYSEIFELCRPTIPLQGAARLTS